MNRDVVDRLSAQDFAGQTEIFVSCIGRHPREAREDGLEVFGNSRETLQKWRALNDAWLLWGCSPSTV